MEKTDLSVRVWGRGFLCLSSPLHLFKCKLAASCYYLWFALPLTLDVMIRWRLAWDWLKDSHEWDLGLKNNWRGSKPQGQCFPRGLLPLNWNIIIVPWLSWYLHKAHLFIKAFAWWCGRLSQCNRRHEIFKCWTCYSSALFPIDIHQFKIW